MRLTQSYYNPRNKKPEIFCSDTVICAEMKETKIRKNHLNHHSRRHHNRKAKWKKLSNRIRLKHFSCVSVWIEIFITVYFNIWIDHELIFASAESRRLKQFGYSSRPRPRLWSLSIKALLRARGDWKRKVERKKKQVSLKRRNSNSEMRVHTKSLKV